MDSRDDETLGLEEVTLVEPSPEVRTRLLASAGAGRFSAFAGPIAAMFEVSVDRAHELLGLIERSASWKSQIPGVEVISFAGGPGLTSAECVFLRLAPGGTFPMHAHVGEESAFVLTGEIRDVTHGQTHGPGGGWRLAGGTRHKLVAQGAGAVCICAVCARDGIVFGAAAAG